MLVLEGESRLARDNFLVKELRIRNLRRAPAGQVRVALTYKIDEDNQFSVKIEEVGNEAYGLQEVNLQTHRLSVEQINELTARA